MWSHLDQRLLLNEKRIKRELVGTFFLLLLSKQQKAYFFFYIYIYISNTNLASISEDILKLSDDQKQKEQN